MRNFPFDILHPKWEHQVVFIWGGLFLAQTVNLQTADLEKQQVLATNCT